MSGFTDWAGAAPTGMLPLSFLLATAKPLLLTNAKPRRSSVRERFVSFTGGKAGVEDSQRK
jgi:hypothetical protein